MQRQSSSHPSGRDPTRTLARRTPGVWYHFPHEADMGVGGIGDTLEQAFSEAAVALSAVICEPSRIRPVETVTVRCDAPDPELLLVDWLNAVVYEMATREMLFSAFEVTISGHHLDGVMSGEHVDPERHQPAVEVKGATYTELRVARTEDGRWLAQCVVDV